MQMNTQPFFIKVLTPLHAGSGSDLGVVDLPIQRESHTSFPKIEASSLKGAIRSKFENNAKSKEEKIQIHRIFGCDDCDKLFPDDFNKDNKDFAGALGFSDARILFFPVKSVRGVFAYVTCPMVLERYTKDTGSEVLTSPKEISFPKSLGDGECFVLADNKNTIDTKNVVILEEYSFKVTEKLGEVKTSLPKELFDDIEKRIVIISDDNFKHFVQNSTEVITRIKIDNSKGTVQQGGLFTEEFLPAESVMYALAMINKPLSQETELKTALDVENFFKTIPSTLQIGGDTNLGKGIVEITIGVKVGDEK